MDINELFRQLAEYKRIQDENAAIIDGLQDEIKAAIVASGKDTIIGTEHKASYKDVTSTRLDSKAIKTTAPDIYNRFSVTTTSKRFTFS